VSACSGHGYKFSSVIGEICADLVTADAKVHDITLFQLGPGR
jgi:sarcosine oxidase